MATFPWSVQHTDDARKAPRRTGVSAAPVPRTTPVPLPILELPFDVRTLVGAWRPGVRKLTLKTPDLLANGRRVALRMAGDIGIDAPVLGTVKDAVSMRGIHSAAIEVDADREPILRRAFEFLEGRAGRPMVRAPRYRMAVPVVVASGYALTYMNTFSLSRGGCGIDWTGAKPATGAFLDMRVGSGTRCAKVRARVRWVKPDGARFKVGVSFLSGDHSAIDRLIAERPRVEET